MEINKRTYTPTKNLKGFPPEILNLIDKRCKEQYNPHGIIILDQVKNNSDKSKGGFTWDNTPEKKGFWSKIFYSKNFRVFYKKYSESSPCDEVKTIIDNSFPITIDSDTAINIIKEVDNTILTKELLSKWEIAFRGCSIIIYKDYYNFMLAYSKESTQKVLDKYLGVYQPEECKKPKFTTLDGVDMFEGDEYHFINTTSLLHIHSRITNKSRNHCTNKNVLRFSTREAAQKELDRLKSLPKCDQLVWVRDNRCLNWEMRFYSHDGRCWHDQKKSTDYRGDRDETTHWKYISTTNPLTEGETLINLKPTYEK